MTSELRVKSTPEALRVLEALAAKAKQKILAILAQEGPMTASELARATGTSLPTVLEHLQSLADAGLVVVEEEARRGRRLKKYRVAAEKVILEVDLKELASHAKKKLEILLDQYLDLRAKGITVKLAPSTRELAKHLGVTAEEARELAAYISAHPDMLAEQLENEALQALAEKPLNVRELAQKLRVDHSLAALIATKLLEKGLIVHSKGKLKARSD